MSANVVGLMPESSMKRRHSLLYLAPYLARHRHRLAVGFLMVLLTVMAGMASPWVLKYVVDSLRVSLAPEKLLPVRRLDPGDRAG